MRRIAWLAPLALAACNGPATSGADLSSSSNDLAGPPLIDLSALADLAMSPMDLARAPDLLAMADMATPPDLAQRAYPPGPYGSNVGDTMGPSLQWEGYINPSATGLATKAPYGALSMTDLHNSGNKFALIYAADFW